MRIENAMQNENRINEIEGFLFDIYNVEEEVHVWILDKDGKPHLFLDHYFPIIYLDGEEKEVRKIIKRIEEYRALKEIPVWVTRKHFYSNQDVRVVKVVISKPSVLRRISQKVYKDPSYPLFGRWHIDSANSFIFKEAMLMGIIELSRISRLPIQRLPPSIVELRKAVYLFLKISTIVSKHFL